MKHAAYIAITMTIAASQATYAHAQAANDSEAVVLPAVVFPAGEEMPPIPQMPAPAADAEQENPSALLEQGEIADSQEEEAAKEEAFSPSYGQFDASILFSTDQIERMKKVLFLSERLRLEKKPETNEVVVDDGFGDLLVSIPEQEEGPIEITAPKSYPTYVVSSIIYRNPRDWVIWLNGKRTTPDNQPDEIKVSRISPRSVSFVWTPREAASFSLHQEALNEAGENVALKKVASKRSTVKQLSDDKWAFSLLPNQTFDARFMAVLEGIRPQVNAATVNVESVTKQMDDATTPEEILRRAGFPSEDMPTSSQGNPASMDDKLKGTLGKMLDTNRRLSGLAGRNDKSSGLRNDSGLTSDKSVASDARAAAAAPKETEASTQQQRIEEALPAFLESIGATPPTSSEDNAGNEGLPLLPTE